MNFSNIGAFVEIIGNGLVAHCAVTCKCVAEFVGKNLHIENGVVKAAENEGSFIFLKAGHIAGGSFARFVFKIHKVVVDHEIDEFAGFGAEFMIHFASLFNKEFCVADGFCVAVREDEFFIVSHNFVNADSLCLGFIKFFAKGNKVAFYLFTESGNFFLAVIASSLVDVAKGSEGFVAKSFAHCGAAFYKFIENFFHFFFVGSIEFGIFCESGFTDFAVGVSEIALDSVKVKNLSVKFDVCGCHKFLIFGGEHCLFLKIGDKFGLEGIELAADFHKKFRAEIFVNFFCEGAFGKSFCVFGESCLSNGKALVKESHFVFIEFVGGVKGVADVCNGEHGFHFFAGFVIIEDYLLNFLIAFCRAKFCGIFFAEFFRFINVRADIFNFVKTEVFHKNRSFQMQKNLQGYNSNFHALSQ